MIAIHITARQLTVTDAIRHYIEKRLGDFDHYSDKISKLDITLGTEKHQQFAEANLLLKGSQALHAYSEHEDLYAAIDGLSDKLFIQLKKQKEKLNEHRE